MPARAVVVGATSVKLIEANKDRTVLAIANPHATQVLYITDDPPAVVANDFPIQPKTHNVLLKKDGDEPQKAWYGIGSGAGTNARLLEQFGEIDVMPEPAEPSPQDPTKGFKDAPLMRIQL